MKTSEILRVPYMLEAESVSTNEHWICRVSFPELPDCVVEHVDVEEAIRQLQCKRLLVLLDTLAEGRMPPLPRGPIRFDPNAGPAATLGLAPLLDALAEIDPGGVPAALAAHPGLAADLARARAQFLSNT